MPVLLALAALAFPTGAAASVTDSSACPDGMLPTVDLVEPALLSSPLHRLTPCTDIAGHVAHFILDTRFGQLSAIGARELETRIRELEVVDELDRASSVGEAARGAGASVTGTARQLARVAGSPIDTLQRLPGGIVTYVRDEAVDLGEDARELGDDAVDAIAGGDDAPRASVRPGVLVGVPDADDAAWWIDGGGALSRIAKRRIGYSAARRRVAERYGVDPYTTNPILHDQLDALAWGATAGETVIGVGTGQLAAGAKTALSGTRRIDRMVWEKTPDDVTRYNLTRLVDAGFDAGTARRFSRNRAFDPNRQSAFVDALLSVAGVTGAALALDVAVGVEGPVDAEVLTASVEAIRSQVFDRGRIDGSGPAKAPMIVVFEATPLLRFGQERLWLPLALDWLEWTPRTRAFFDGATFRVADKTLALSGAASPKALRELTRRGWEIDVPRSVSVVAAD